MSRGRAKKRTKHEKRLTRARNRLKVGLWTPFLALKLAITAPYQRQKDALLAVLS